MHQYTGNIHKVLRWTMISGIFALPLIALIVSTGLFFPYIVGKNFAFRIIIEIIFSAWVVLAVLDARYRPRWTPLLIAVTTFVGIVLLAGLLGENPYKSFWSNYERMDGTITLLHVLAYIFVAQSVMTTEKLWLWFWRVSLAVSTGIALHTFVQFLSEAGNGVRLYSTLGNPIYLAVYALFHIFIALILATHEKALWWERTLYLATLPLLFFAVYLTSTRGASLGIIVGLFITVIGIAWSKRKNKKIMATSVVAGVVVSVLVGGFFIERDSHFVQNDPLLKRFASLSLSDASISARTMIWNMAIEGVKERPVLGWGQENFNYVFNTHYNPDMYSHEQWYDRTHNVVFDWLIASGVLGLLAYFAIFCALFYALYKSVYFTVVQKWIIFGMLSAYTFQNLTVFDQVVSYILFFSVVLWVMAQFDVLSDDTDKESKKQSVSLWGALAVLPISFILIWGVNWSAYNANKTLLDALRQEGTAARLGVRGDIVQARSELAGSLLLFKKASKYHSFGDQEIHEQLSQAAINVLGYSWVKKETKNQWYASAENGLIAQSKLAPKDARFPFFEATLHGVAGQYGLEKDALEKANEFTPNKPMVLLLLAKNAILRGDFPSARVYAKKVYTLEPKYKNAVEIYGLTLLLQKDADAFNVLVEYEGGVLGTMDSILKVLVKQNEYVLAHTLWERGLHIDDSPKQVFKLALAYVAIGDVPRATRAVHDAVGKYPTLKAIGDSILSNIHKKSKE